MPRKARTPAHQARTGLLRGRLASCPSPHLAIEQRALPEEEWQAMVEGRAARYFMQNGLKARMSVRKRHPMRTSTAET